MEIFPMQMNERTICSSGAERCQPGPAVSGRVRKALERGVTLVEVLIVVAIIAMVASGVAVFALPRYKEAQIKSAETGARVIRGAIQNWQRINNESTCPTISQLVQEKHLDSASNTADPWNEQYQLSCTDDDVTVASNGPDKKKGTPDDIRVPKGLATGTQ
jgi:general secretion pathway protein G